MLIYPGNSILSTANYVARKYGCRSAMPTHVAKLLCPQLVLLPLNGYKYKEASEKFMAIVEEYDPDYSSMGLDEASLDVTDYFENNGIEPTKVNAEKLMLDIRTRVNQEISITASSGFACNPMLAKLCSEKNKPNGQCYLVSNQQIIEDFMGKLDIRKIPGVGPQSEDVLKGLGIKTAMDMRERLLDLFIIYGDYEKFMDYAQDCYGISRVAKTYIDSPSRAKGEKVI